MVSASLILIASPFALAETDQGLAEYFRRAEQYGFSGSVLVTRGGEILLHQAYGYADHARGIRATVDTAFDVGSVTKQFTAAAILLLESRGKLHTGDSIGDYLEFVPEDKKPVTIHHLLSHTSGLGDYYWDQNVSLDENEYLRKMSENPLSGTPGEQFQYSNYGYHLLKAIIERVSGVDYETYLRENLFLPCGMQHTGFHQPDWADGQVAQYQDWSTRSSILRVQDPLSRPVYLQPEGSGGILSTPLDLFKWHQSLSGNTILPADATSRMFKANLDNYGYGWRIWESDRGTTVIEHGGFDTWLGTLAGFYRFVDEDVVIIVLANTTLNRTLRHEHLVRQIENAVFDGSFSMPPEPHEIDTKSLAAYTGVYSIAGDEEIVISVRNGQLIAAAKSPAAIRLLTFPDSGVLADEIEYETELTSLLTALQKEQFDANTFDLNPRVDVERFVRIWTGRLKRLERDRGGLQLIREVHSHGFVYHGEPETHHYAYLKFTDGQEILREVRTESGLLALDIFGLPEQLELTLAPTSDGVFHGWNFRLGVGPRLNFTPDADQELRIEGSRASTIARK